MSTIPTRFRRGFSLMELMLVLALVVAMAALVAPSVVNSFESQSLRGAASQVRSQWSQARVKAMRSGCIYAFVFSPDAGTYRIEPWLDVGDELSADVALGYAAEPTTMEGTLPEGVTFVSGEIGFDTRSMAAEQGAAGPLGTTAIGDSSQNILFYPDGVTSSERVILKTEKGLALPIELRGLTGISRIGEIFDTGAEGP